MSSYFEERWSAATDADALRITISRPPSLASAQSRSQASEAQSRQENIEWFESFIVVFLFIDIPFFRLNGHANSL